MWSVVFSEEAVKKISSDLEVSEDKVRKCLSSIGLKESNCQKEVKIVNDSETKEKKKDKKDSKDEINLCERIPRNKTSPCGKRAHHFFEDHWYCGSEKSGCYKSIIGAAKRKKETKETKNTLLEKVVNKKKVHVTTITIDGKNTKINPDNNVVFNDEMEIIGVFKDGETKPLSDKEIRWAEANNLIIKSEKIEEDSESESD